MAWIESHDNLKDHPKTRRAARLLGVSVPTVIGHMHLLWHWCLSYAEDGDLSGYDAADIAEAVMWDGDPDQLIEALINCGPAGKAGFLERDAQGRLLVHDWHDYAGKLIEKREEAREAGARGNHERWHVQRGIVDPTCPYCQEASAQDGQVIWSPSGGESGGDSQPESEPNRVLSHRTVPNLTVPNQTIGDHIVEPAGTTPPKPAKPEPKFGPGDPPYELARHLRAAILDRDPTTKVPEETPEALARWATEADRMIRFDGRDLHEAADLMMWCQQDSFWSANILSMSAFRRQYDRLKRQSARADPHAKAGQRETAVDRMLRERGVRLA